MQLILTNFFQEIKEDEEDPSQSPSGETNQAESDVSDVEEAGYCDDSSASNVELIMKLERVREKKIKKMYNTSVKVSAGKKGVERKQA